MTNRYGLIGFPLGHSFSKKYFTDKFLTQSIDSVYDILPLEDINDLPELLTKLPDLKGFNVTIPHKKSIIPLLESISDEAAIINAVNTVKVSYNDGAPHLEGFNTDAPAFESELVDFTENRSGNALILGTGGSSASVAYVLKKQGWNYRFVSRRADTNAVLSYDDLTEDIITESKLIVNCTPLGMHPQIETYPRIPYHALSSNHYLYDLVYNPEMTAFLLKGEQHGAHIRNGLGMLYKQADLAWEIWQNDSLNVKSVNLVNLFKLNMQSQMNQTGIESTLPDDSNIIASKDTSGKIELLIPAKGFKGKGLITVIVIGIWMLTILVWSALLLMMKPVYVLYSLPFWAIGIHTLIKAVKVLTLEQAVVVDDSSITLRMKRGDKTEERTFNKNEVIVSIVEGSYYSYAGFNKRGHYPAIIHNKEAFGFAERTNPVEKKWLADYLNAGI